MFRFFIVSFFIIILSCVFIHPHNIKRRGVQIRGSFGQGLKNKGIDYTQNRFAGDKNSLSGHHRVQITGSFGGKKPKPSTDNDILLGNRFGEKENNKTENNKFVGGGCVTLPIVGGDRPYPGENQAGPGIGCKSIELNEILSNAGLGGSKEDGNQTGSGVQNQIEPRSGGSDHTQISSRSGFFYSSSGPVSVIQTGTGSGQDQINTGSGSSQLYTGSGLVRLVKSGYENQGGPAIGYYY